MSHRLKAKAPLKQRRDEQAIRVMARQLFNQTMLDKLLAGARPDLREAMIARLRPYLPFTPDIEITVDCPQCGMRRGSILAHACLGVN